MNDRDRALGEIVSIARRHALTGTDITAALADVTTAPGDAAGPQAEGPRHGVLVKALGYIGGTFVFAGVGVFIALQWDSMNAAARIIITLGSGIAAYILAVLANREARYEKAAAPLFLMAAALEPTGMLVAFNELGSGGDWRWASLITTGTMAGQFGATFATIRRSTPLFFVVFFATLFWWTAFDLLDADDGVVGLVIGASMLAAAAGIDRTPHRVITPVWYLFGTALFLYGLFDALEGTPLEILFLAAACGFVYLSAVLQSRTVLFVATAAILAYTAWFTGEHFASSLGWPLALVMFGLLMIGLSAVAFRIDRQYIRSRR